MIQFNGYNFRINGVLLDLALNTPIEIDARNVLLEGYLDSGTRFSYFLNSGVAATSLLSGPIQTNLFHVDATIVVSSTSQVPTPTTGALLVLGIVSLAFRRRKTA